MGNKPPSPTEAPPPSNAKEETQGYLPSMTLEEATEHVRVHGVRAAALALHTETALVRNKEAQVIANPVCHAIVQTLGELASSVHTRKDETPGNRHGQYVEFGVGTHIRNIMVSVCDDLLLLRGRGGGDTGILTATAAAAAEDENKGALSQALRLAEDKRRRDKENLLKACAKTLAKIAELLGRIGAKREHTNTFFRQDIVKAVLHTLWQRRESSEARDIHFWSWTFLFFSCRSFGNGGDEGGNQQTEAELATATEPPSLWLAEPLLLLHELDIERYCTCTKECFPHDVNLATHVDLVVEHVREAVEDAQAAR